MMGAGRFVVLGLAQARSPWFRAVAQWSNSASIPVEFVKCMSPIEVRAHLASGRAFSALLVDGGISALDRDLVDRAREAGCAVVVVDDVRISRDWAALGASAVINPIFDRDHLLEVLTVHASEIIRGDVAVTPAEASPPTVERGRVAMVCGPGGTGASTVAIALAQGLCDGRRYGTSVLLADLALHGEQAMLHDARDVVPGIQELVDAHRTRRPGVDEVRTFAFDVQERQYQLLLGLRRARNWSSIRQRAFAATFDSVRAAWGAVVCDVDADLEGEDDGGSADVEERHLLARTVAANADVAFVVGQCGMKGVHSLVRVIGELLDHDVPSERIVPVLNQSPRSARSRAELVQAVPSLLQPRVHAGAMASPIFLPERRVDEALRDGVRLPAALAGPLAGAFEAVIDRAGARRPRGDRPQAVVAGSLGHWAAESEPA